MADSVDAFVLRYMLDVMKKEIRVLLDYIKHELHVGLELSGYRHGTIPRTGKTMESIYISQEPKIEGNSIVASIGFKDDLVLHDSIMGNGQPQGNTAWLLNVGWDISDKVGYTAPFFTNHPGFHYIEKAVNRFNSERKQNGIQVSVYVGDNKYI